MTIGDVLAAVAAIFGVGTAWGAAVLLTGLALPNHTRRAQETLTGSPFACAVRGLIVGLAGGFAVALLMQTPVGKLLAAVLAACLSATAALGSAGIVAILGERIQEMGTLLSPFAARTRAAGLYVAAGFLPIVGWFVAVPVALALSLGAGAAAWRKPRLERVPVPRITADSAEVTA